MARILRAPLALACVAFLVATGWAGTYGFKQLSKRPNEYGNVMLYNYSSEDTAPVVFKHWVHRAKYSCRLCHVDIGFGMKANQTGVTCKDIEYGMYCGSCHRQGGEAFGRAEGSIIGRGVPNCDRCHSLGREVQFKYDFYEFSRGLPRERFGNGINWQAAEEKGLIKLKDYLEGVSIKRKRLENPKEMTFGGTEKGMMDIIFSHEKHAVWSGCELCHPEMFGVKAGGTVYSMEDIFNGMYCGACHDLVAFPNRDCQRCHTKEV